MERSSWYVLILSIFCLFLSSNVVNIDLSDNGEIKSTFDLLKDGEKEIILNDQYKDIVMVLGNTGGGKSTFTQWLAGDNDKLISKEIKEGTGEFIIEDNNRIGNSTIQSKTIFPELVIENRTNTPFYDCPGFSDTRSTSNDIATTYFIKKVVDHAKSVKIVFVISYPSVRIGVDRQDFMKLARHATELIKDISKYQKSIALVATKVDNQYIKQGKGFVLVEDSKIIDTIANFLQEVKQDLEQKSNIVDISKNELKFNENVIQFLDALLMKESGNYTKIGIFRRPDEAGPLSNITLLKEGKMHVEQILYKNLKFTEKQNDDFGYTISEKSKIDINDLVEEINKNMWSIISALVQKIQEYFNDLVTHENIKLDSFVNDVDFIYADETEAQIFLDEFNNGYNKTFDLVNAIKNVKSQEELVIEIIDSISGLNINFSSNLSSVLNQAQYFDFLQVVSEKQLSTKPWNELFNSIVHLFENSNRSIHNKGNDFSVKINNNIKLKVNNIAGDVRKYFDKSIENLEVQKMISKLYRGHLLISDLTENIKNISTVYDLCNEFRDIIHNLDLSTTADIILSIKYDGKYFEYLQILNTDLKLRPTDWVYPFEELSRYLYESEMWYTFLYKVYVTFSRYEIQRDREKYNVANINDWGTSGKSQGIEITKSNAKLFLDKLGKSDIKEVDIVKNKSLSDLQLSELNHVLSLTLRHSVKIQCKDSIIFIEGAYISMDQVNQNKHIIDSCINSTGLHRHIYVFASNTIFFDKDVTFDVNETLPIITVIAPKWDVSVAAILGINGVNGKNQTKGGDGRYPGSRGDDGKPGKAGKPGGTFFGIVSNIINGDNLTIIANGGMGGSGGNGGNGHNGKGGVNAIVPSASQTSCVPDLCDDNKKLNGFRCEQTGCNSIVVVPSGFPGGVDLTRTTDCKYKIYGIPGDKGGEGGNGGRGGKAGCEGNTLIFQLDSFRNISTITNAGKDGHNGTGGLGGANGENGNDFNVYCTAPDFWKFRFKTYWYLKGTIDNKRREIAKTGKTGANAENIEKPLDPAGINNLNKPINAFKLFLLEGINDSFRKKILIDFLNKINSDNNVQKVYDTLSLVDEMKGLESQFYKLNADDLYNLYQSLLNRVSEYAKSPKPGEKNNDYKKILSYLYTTILGRIYNLNETIESNLIIDLRLHLNLVKNDILVLKNLQNQNNKVDIIMKYKEDYKSNIDRKTDEALKFVEDKLVPEIDQIASETDSKIDLLIKETLELQKQAIEEREKLDNKRRDLEYTMRLRGLFGCFKIVGQVFSFLGPVGAVAGSVIEAVTTVTESLALNDETSDLQLLKLPPGVVSDLETQIVKIKGFKEQRVANLQKILDEAYDESIQYSKTLNETSSKIVVLKKKLSILVKTNYDVKQIQLIEIEFKEELTRKENELKTRKDISDKNFANAKAVIGKFKKALQLGLDIYNRYKNDKAALDAIISSMEQSEIKYEELKQYERKIYDFIAPMLKNIENDLHDIDDKLNTKSQVALDITKWQVEDTLKDTIFEIKQMTSGFKVENSIVRSIDKLSDVITTIINVYDRIQGYREQQNLANYIADISSVQSSRIKSNDPMLNNAVNHLEENIRSNIVLKEYETVINAFKQWVFPFSDLYLKDLELPSYLQIENNIENIVLKAVEDIERIATKLDIYKSSVKSGYDEFIFKGKFDSKYVSSEPFYVWKKEQHKDIIMNLLSGEKVIIKSDILKSPFGKDAIKFSLIDFNFRSQNETLQVKINDTLKNFDISATHFGNSYYRYDDKIYVITSNRQTFNYSIETDEDRKRIRKNSVYEKMESGDLMLSPYALWEIQLFNTSDRVTFENLKLYKDEIDLELVGFGSYVIKGVTINKPLNVKDTAIASYNNFYLTGNSEIQYKDTQYSLATEDNRASETITFTQEETKDQKMIFYRTPNRKHSMDQTWIQTSSFY